MSFLSNIVESAPDPIVKLMDLYNADDRDGKINLGIGIYKDEDGRTPIFRCVKAAEERLLGKQETKEYVGVGGDLVFVDHVGKKIFKNASFTGIQGVGGSGALKVLAEFCKEVAPDSVFWIPNPTWGNHKVLFESSGLTCKQYTYKAITRDNLLEDAIDSLKDAKEGDFVVIHACCHNPTGIDFTPEQRQEFLNVVKEKKLVPFIDAAYLGFAGKFTEDAGIISDIADQFPVVMCAFSASKNFAVYRDRVGIPFVTGQDAAELKKAKGLMLKIARSIYSMPPDHGAAVLRMIFEDDALYSDWQVELDEARARIQRLRTGLCDNLEQLGFEKPVDHIRTGTGLFALLPVSVEAVTTMREKNGIYMMDNGRMNIAGLQERRLPETAQAMVSASQQRIAA